MTAFIGKGYEYHKLNKQLLTARDQEHILAETGLNKHEIKDIQTTIKNSGADTAFMNSGKRISFGKMRKILKKHDPELSRKVRTGLKNYNKQFTKEETERQAAAAKTNTIKANIARTRKYDIKRERGKEYMKERLLEQKLKGLREDGKDTTAQEPSEYHILKGPDTSVRRWSAAAEKTNNTPDHETSAQAAKRKTDSFNKLKEQSNNLPDLPI